MAARKKAARKTFTSPNILKARRVIFKRRKASKVVRALKPSARGFALVDSKRTWKIKMLKNGLLDMKKTPPCMLEVTKRNATDSPLLRLPGELRNKIWRYSLTGNIVNIHDADTRPDAIVCKGHTVGVVGEDNPMRWPSTRAEDKPRLPTAFHLSEVCRQIYHEVGTLAYSGSIFFFCNWNDEGGLIRAWTRTSTSAHRNAVTDIAIDDMNFDFYLDYKVKLRSAFPGLQCLHLNTYRVNTVFARASDGKNENFIRQRRKFLEDKKQRRVDKRENEGVKLIWHVHPIEDYKLWETTDGESKVESSFSEGENETDSQAGADDDEAVDSEGEDSTEYDDDDSDYDSEMLDLTPY